MKKSETVAVDQPPPKPNEGRHKASCASRPRLGQYEEDDCDCGAELRKAVAVDQPPPKPNEGRAVWELVIEDVREIGKEADVNMSDFVGEMVERDRIGRERYGAPLQPHNGRVALVDGLQEAFDLLAYLRQDIAERGSAAELAESGDEVCDIYDDALVLCHRAYREVLKRRKP